MANDRFIFFRSYIDAIECLPEKQQLGVLKCIISFALDGKEPKGLHGAAAAIFAMARPVILSRPRGGQPGNHNGPNGRRGNEPNPEPNQGPGQEPNQEPNRNPIKNIQEPNKPNSKERDIGYRINGNMDIGEREKERENISEDPNGSPSPAPSQNFHLDKVPPDPDEIEAYARQFRIPHSLVVKFFTHYSANGWMMGNNRIVNWGAALVKWATDEKILH